MLKKVTARWLRKKGACENKVRAFERLFPAGAVITLANLKRAAANNLDIDWLAKTIFTAPDRKAYEKAIVPARKVYEKAIAPAWEDYLKAIAPAWKAYLKAIAPAIWSVYEKGQYVIK